MSLPLASATRTARQAWGRRPSQRRSLRASGPNVLAMHLADGRVKVGIGGQDSVGPGEGGGSGSCDRPTLLIVDDQAINLHAMFQMFKADYKVLMASTGEQAVSVCRAALPDLVLLDVRMPGMDGYEVCRHLKCDAGTAHIPIIFVTASDDPREEADCLNVGGVDFISKPVNPMVVRSRVVTHITLKQQADTLRQSAQELTSAQRLGRVGSWSWKKATKAANCSPQLCDVLGVAEHPDLPFQDIKAMFLPGSWFNFLRAIARARKGLATSGTELAHVRHDGSTGWLLSNVEPVLSSGGEVVAIRGTALDISAQKQVDQMRAAKDVAEMASLHKTRFLSSMSHELRTPLNAVLGFAQILSFSPIVQQSQSLHTNVSHILDAGRHLLDMVNDILDMACVESGKIDLQMVVLDLNKVVRECLDMSSAEASTHALCLSARTSSASNLIVADDRRLRQIMLNLISNAIKYNAMQGSVIVTVDAGEDEVRVSVTDTGPGLSKAQLASLFEPFNRLGAENSNVPGTGIGLVLAQRLAVAMAGRIECQSTLGHGTTFTLILPAAKVASR